MKRVLIAALLLFTQIAYATDFVLPQGMTRFIGPDGTMYTPDANFKITITDPATIQAAKAQGLAAYAGSSGGTCPTGNNCTFTGVTTMGDIATNNIFPVTAPTYGAKCDGVTNDSAAFQLAVNAAAVAGGVVTVPAGVCYKPSHTTLPGPVGSENGGVAIVGVPWAVSPGNVVIAGTELLGNGTDAAFVYNNTAAGSQPTLAVAVGQGASGINIKDIAFQNYTYAVQAGGLYNTSFFHSYFSNLIALNSTQWGFWFENFQESVFNRLFAFGPTSGGAGNMMFAASQSAFTQGNSKFDHLYGQNGASGTRGVIFRAYGGVSGVPVSINDLNVNDVQDNQHGANISATATCTGTTTITLSAFSGSTSYATWAIDMPISAAAVGGGGWGPGWETLFVTSNTGTSITVSPVMGDSAVNITCATGTYTVYSNGYPSIEAEGYGHYSNIQSSSIYGIDAEGTASTPLLVQNFAGQIDIGTVFDVQGTASSDVFTSFVCRGANGTWRSSGSMTYDGDAQCAKGFNSLGMNALTDTYPNSWNINSNFVGWYYDRANAINKVLIHWPRSTGSQTATLGSNAPAAITTLTPNTWETITLPDGTNGYVPVWK